MGGNECLILGEKAIQQLLLGLEREDIKQLQSKIIHCLQRLSTSDEAKYQPDASIVNRPTGQKILFRPSTSADAIAVKIIVDPAPIKDKSGAQQKLPLNGLLALCDLQGRPTGFLNAQAVTGIRTALNALIPYTYRARTDNILVFGAGVQALWHVRLALTLRGSEIKRISVCNRTRSRSESLVQQMRSENERLKKATVDFEILDLKSGEEDKHELLRSRLSTADIIFCTVGSKDPLFKLADLSLASHGKKPLITAVGSWQADMIELDPALMHQLLSDESGFHPQNKGGALLVDDRKAALQHSGEVVQAGLTMDQMIGIGEVTEMFATQNEQSSRLKAWLSEGLVVYKSIGVSLTDLAVGNAILSMAEERSLGVVVPDF